MNISSSLNHSKALDKEHYERLTFGDSNTSKRTGYAYKNAQNEKLGHFLERANKLLKHSSHNSIRSSCISSSKEQSIMDTSYENNEAMKPLKKVAVFLDKKTHMIIENNGHSRHLRRSLNAPASAYVTRK